MGGVAAQPLTLAKRLVDQPHLALLQVAQAAVHQFRALRRGAPGEVVGLDQGGAQAAGGGVECHAHPGDAAAHHHDVELLMFESAQHVGTIERGGGGGHSAHPTEVWFPWYLH